MRILVADDNDLVRGAIRSLLAAEADWEICGEASDGASALRNARELQPDLVLLDISMPLATGFQIARSLRQDIPQIKILIISQEDAAQLAPSAFSAGADGCVDKARIARDLVDAIKNLKPREISGAAGS